MYGFEALELLAAGWQIQHTEIRVFRRLLVQKKYQYLMPNVTSNSFP
jgi:hypothetical protein